jgi:hypothetical protein
MSDERRPVMEIFDHVVESIASSEELTGPIHTVRKGNIEATYNGTSGELHFVDGENWFVIRNDGSTDRLILDVRSIKLDLVDTSLGVTPNEGSNVRTYMFGNSPDELGQIKRYLEMAVGPGIGPGFEGNGYDNLES